MLILGENIEPLKILGSAIKVYLKDGGAFPFRVVGAGKNFIVGYDDEMMDLHINLNDIDFIIEGEKEND
jgi:hypothetical protein